MNKLKSSFFQFIVAYHTMPLLFFCTATAWGETENNRKSPQIRFTGGGVSSAEVQGAGADVSATGLKSNVSYRDFFSYERLDYSWDHVEKLPFGNGNEDPWNTFHVINFGYTRQGAISSRWSYFAGGSVSSSFEDQIQDSYGIGAFGGLTYLYSDTLQFTIGAALPITPSKPRFYQ